MALTPTVADAAVIQTSWGNEIRNRTIQVFATQTELDGWAAPNGSVGYALDLNRFKVRSGGSWVPFSACLASNINVVTDAAGQATITHGMGAVPRSVIVTPNYATNGTVGVIQVMSATANTFVIRAMKVVPPGTVTNATIGVYWMASL